MPVCVCSINNTAVGELIDKLEEEHNWDLLRTRRVSNSGEHRSITPHTSGGGSIDGSVSISLAASISLAVFIPALTRGRPTANLC